MYQPSYRSKLEAITNSRAISKKSKENQVNQFVEDPFIIKQNEQVTEPTNNLWQHQIEDRVNQFTKDPFVIEQEEIQIKDTTNDWKKEQIKKQNQTATLLEVQEDEEDGELVVIAENIQKQQLQVSLRQQAEIERHQRLDALLGKKDKGYTRPKSKVDSRTKNPIHQRYQIQYKGIKIKKIEQLNLLKNLITPNLKKHWNNINKPIEVRGILAEVNQKKVGLILADISSNNGVAKIVSVVVLSRKHHSQIKAKLINYLEKSLPQLNCDRLELMK